MIYRINVLCLSFVFLVLISNVALAGTCPKSFKSCLVYGSPNGGQGSIVWEFDKNSGKSLGSGVHFPCLHYNLRFLPNGEIEYLKPARVKKECKSRADQAKSIISWEIFQNKQIGTQRLRLLKSPGACEFATRFDLKEGSMIMGSDCQQILPKVIEFRYYKSTKAK